MTSPQTLQSTYRLSSGHEIPILGYGVSLSNVRPTLSPKISFKLTKGKTKSSPSKTESPVLEAFSTGYRHVDSAIMYRNEKACGRAIAKSGLDRSQIFFTTKIPPGDMGYERTKRAVESSLREAGVEYFDLILIHAPYGGTEDRLGSWKALVEAQKAGKTKSIGVSNYGIHHLDELEEYIQQGGGGTIDVGQYEIHPWCAREDIVEWLQKRNIVVEAYSPLAHGTRMGETVLKELGKKYNKSPAQIMIRWCLQRGLVPLPKSATPSRIRENAEVFDFELDEEDMKRLFTGEYKPTDWDPTLDFD
ncbi:Aldo/keto reductase family protein [Aspergillus parasiticus SU-1]|uniref:D-xylose reductase [NAD(P)H] n=1 Tax=Aspergillus parasiticus (strain ATCC 56775 / NRRL 5862 / SRRC 143 / SU-1) TaxID=1403190 RepID=A0A0F0IMY2_ASPPU|nr:Aldo/keto reductase family protein [Aspergillus parasiticus SU-1]